MSKSIPRRSRRIVSGRRSFLFIARGDVAVLLVVVVLLLVVAVVLVVRVVVMLVALMIIVRVVVGVYAASRCCLSCGCVTLINMSVVVCFSDRLLCTFLLEKLLLRIEEFAFKMRGRQWGDIR